jgi:hypothetical protein
MQMDVKNRVTRRDLISGAVGGAAALGLGRALTSKTNADISKTDQNMFMKATCELTDERLITREGTIIPCAVRFANGRMVVAYSVGPDAPFSPGAAHRSPDDGQTWEKVECPIPGGGSAWRTGARGAVGPNRALFFGDYLWKVGENEYVCFYLETLDSGMTFGEPKQARFHVENVLDHAYVPRPHDHPGYIHAPDVPELYHSLTKEHGAILGPRPFGTVLRLPDGALGMSLYGRMKGNLTHRKEEVFWGRAPVAHDPFEGVAEEGKEEILTSSLFFRSEDEGRSWTYASTIGRMEPGRPFDGGRLFSEGFNETGMACTSDGKIYALMRHGSYMLLWWAWSEDNGRTWGGPWGPVNQFNYPGVAPCVTMMPNGVLAAAWGRPGMTVGFSLDGTGLKWDLLVGVMDDGVPSQKYPWIVPIADDRLMLFYDKRRWDSQKQKMYDHGIYCREIALHRD